MSDDDLLIAADSMLSLIYYREGHLLTEQTQKDLPPLLHALRARTDQIVAARRAQDTTEDQR